MILKLLYLVLIYTPFILALLVAGVYGISDGKLAIQPQKMRKTTLCLKYASFGLIASYIILVIFHLIYPSYFDPIEGHFTVQSLDVFHHPVYTALSGANRYSMLYGPLPYVFQHFFIIWFDDPILGSKIYGTGLLALSLGLFWMGVLKPFSKPIKGLVMLYTVFLLFLGLLYPMLNRADTLILFGIVVALFALVCKNRFLVIGCAAVGMGLAIDSKIHGVLYCLPILYLLYQKYGTKIVALIGIGLTGLCLLPFLFLPTLNLSLYLTWVLEAVKHLFYPSICIRNLYAMGIYLIPLSLTVWIIRKHDPNTDVSPIYVLVGCMTMLCLIASKNGAGHWHLMPFVPTITWLYGNYLARYRAIFTTIKEISVLSLALMILFIIVTSCECIRLQAFAYYHYYRDFDRISMAKADLQLIEKQFPHESIVMGVGGSKSYELTYLYPLLYKTVGENFLVPPAIMDMQLSGLEIPSATIQKIRSKQIDIFLLPKDSQIFSLPGYFPNRSIFSKEFIDSFIDSYKKIGESQFYEIWHSK